MLGINKQKLIIVCDKNTEMHANYLYQLISSSVEREIIGIEDGKIDAVVWEEKHYISNKPTINIDNYVLFIGENNSSKKEIKTMGVKYNKFGMKFGWRGKHGMLIVNNSEDKSENDEFEKYVQSKLGEYKFEKCEFNGGKEITVNEKILVATSIIGRPLTLGATSIIAGPLALGASILLNNTRQKYIEKNKKYNFLITIFFKEGLSKFMEE